MVVTTGIEIELTFLLLLTFIGQTLFARFEIETPRWRLIVKWLVLYAVTLGLHPVIGHWALAAPALAGTVGLAVHFSWCRRHGIHPFTAEPLPRYYALRGWRWPPSG